jgi:glycosyltransferase involved in cell wall biosynthesis
MNKSINNGFVRYALVTPARNEEHYISKTLDSVISQTLKPVRWVIVSDGSTDRTDDIVREYQKKVKWIDLIRMPEHRDRQFAAKVHCFNAGYRLLQSVKYDLIGNLDADVMFDKDYFQFLLGKFSQIPQLGVAGTPFEENGFKSFEGKFINLNHVSGACQIFRKSCFEDIGGYIPIKGGGIDWAAVTSARMKGWKTQTFTDKTYYHLRKMGTAKDSILMSRFRHGQKDYYLGGDPLWQLIRSIYQMSKKPYVLSGFYLLTGYLSSWIGGTKSPLPQELVRFHRKEQNERLRAVIKRMIPFNTGRL